VKATSILVRASLTVAVLSWSAATALICLDAVGNGYLGVSVGIVTTWLMGVGALFLILPMASGGDQRINTLISEGLPLGDPALDTLLVGGTPRRWRAIPWVGTALTALATTAWTVSLIYSIQLGLGVYHLPPDISLGVLRLLMATAVWPTVGRVAGTADARQRAVYEVACDAHHALRGNLAACERDVAASLRVLEGGGARSPWRSPRNGGNGRVAPGA
jgi:hypothetical protein